ncbi:hypothetical protein ACVCAH_01675 [Micromonospora sp. LZ34]
MRAAGVARLAAAGVAVGALVWPAAPAARAQTTIDPSATPPAVRPSADPPARSESPTTGSWGGDVIPLAALGLGLVALGTVLNGAHRQEADD